MDENKMTTFMSSHGECAHRRTRDSQRNAVYMYGRICTPLFSIPSIRTYTPEFFHSHVLSPSCLSVSVLLTSWYHTVILCR